LALVICIKIDFLTTAFVTHPISLDVNTYVACQEYLRSLSIVWQRIGQGYKDVGAILAQPRRIQSDQSRTKEFGSLMVDQHGLMNVLQFDLFARIFMDKVGQVIEKRIVLPPGKRPRNSFTDHRKYVARLSIHPAYSNLLQNK
jgi:hypothetical protein